MDKNEIQKALTENYENHLCFGIAKDNMDVLTSQNIGFLDVLQICCTALHHCAGKTMDVAALQLANGSHSPEETAEALTALKGEIYDSINVAITNVLLSFAPEIEQRPDLTAQAILEAENAILDKTPEPIQFPGKKENG